MYDLAAAFNGVLNMTSLIIIVLSRREPDFSALFVVLRFKYQQSCNKGCMQIYKTRIHPFSINSTDF